MPYARANRIGRVLVFLMLTLTFLAISAAVIGVAFGHTAPSGFEYERLCCHSQDCAPADVFEREGTMWVRNSMGEAPFPTDQSKYRSSPDGKYHACFYGNRTELRCLYVPSGS